MGSYAILTGCMLVAVSFVVGYFLGAPGQIRKSDLAIQTSFRGISAAVAIAITNFPTQPQVLNMVLINLMWALPVLLIVAPFVLRRKNVAAAQAGGGTTVAAEESRRMTQPLFGLDHHSGPYFAIRKEIKSKIM